MQAETTYFEKPGPSNTAETVKCALERAKELNINHVVIASNSGNTAELCLGHGMELTWVTHQIGYANPGEDEAEPEKRQKLAAQGVKILTATHLMAGIERALRLLSGGVYPAEIVAHTLRIFGQGVKVCVECSVMALDAGMIPLGVPVMAIGGTGRGSDTAVILRPAHSQDFFRTKVIEICCKPRMDVKVELR